MTFIASLTNQNPIKKANMMLLSKEETSKDQSLEIQMFLSLDKSDSSNSEKIWKKKAFFDFTLIKPKFPENTLVCCNQSTISTLKAGDYGIYLEYVLLGRILLVQTSTIIL